MLTYRRTFIVSTVVLSLLSFGGAATAQSDGSEEGPAALEGTAWQLSRMAARGPWDMTIDFGAEGAFGATTPCFDVAGRYATEADAIEIEATKVADSDGNEALCDIVQEAGGDVLVQALADAQRWSIDASGTLSITPESGVADYELTLEPLAETGPVDVPALGSFAGSWVLVDVISQTGEPAPLPESLMITLEFDETGVIRGSAGCGTYEGTYTYDESAGMAIGAVTGEAVEDCAPTVARWHQEYLRLIESVDEVSVDGERLVLGTDPWGFDLYFAEAS